MTIQVCRLQPNALVLAVSSRPDVTALVDEGPEEPLTWFQHRTKYRRLYLQAIDHQYVILTDNQSTLEALVLKQPHGTPRRSLLNVGQNTVDSARTC